MFDQKEIEAYRNIKVPSELKTRILADCNAESARGKRNIGGALPRSGMIRSLSAIAACLVLAVALFSVMGTGSVDLSYAGAIVSDEATLIGGSASLASYSSRVVSPAGVPLSIDVSGKAEIAVSGGVLYRLSDDGTEILELGNRAEIRGQTDIWWEVTEAAVFELTVTAKGNQATYILDLTEMAPNGVIYKK